MPRKGVDVISLTIRKNCLDVLWTCGMLNQDFGDLANLTEAGSRKICG